MFAPSGGVILIMSPPTWRWICLATFSQPVWHAGSVIALARQLALSRGGRLLAAALGMYSVRALVGAVAANPMVAAVHKYVSTNLDAWLKLFPQPVARSPVPPHVS